MKNILAITLILTSFGVFSQSYAPAAGQEGSTAIPYDSEQFVAWATGIEVVRGYVNIDDPTFDFEGSNKASFGEPEWALGPASNISTEAVSLGDAGYAIVTFNKPITNGPGFDFAIFENAVTDDFLELAHVEVSSDGIHFVRFPSHSETQTETQIGSFGSVQPTYLHNLAGKYRVGFGTPFDLEELKDEPNLDVTQITHVKIIDVVGSIGENGSLDSYGNKINDLFPTPFHSGGFDLNGVGVINEYQTVNVKVETIQFDVFPNPSNGIVNVHWNNGEIDEISVFNSLGKEVVNKQVNAEQSVKLELTNGIYFVKIQGGGKMVTKKVVVR